MAYLGCSPGKTIVDGTLGGGGHARRIVRAIRPGGCLVAIDRDPEALRNARSLMDAEAVEVRLVHDSFAHLPDILAAVGIDPVDGILIDLGISRDQIEASGRGFSFQREEPLDMRMDPSAGEPASHWVNRRRPDELERLFREFGEERFARRIARAIDRERRKAPIDSSLRLAEIIAAAVPGGRRGAGRPIHPATRCFMALRIAVNGELDHLDAFLAHGLDCLRSGGRLCILSFHSLEDRRVKRRFRELAARCTCPPSMVVCRCGGQPSARLLTRKAVRPTAAEVDANPLARSTRLRALEKL
jgi:16S rRNA (cytosine1402-N4)-methyltransferase